MSCDLYVTGKTMLHSTVFHLTNDCDKTVIVLGLLAAGNRVKQETMRIILEKTTPVLNYPKIRNSISSVIWVSLGGK